MRYEIDIKSSIYKLFAWKYSVFVKQCQTLHVTKIVFPVNALISRTVLDVSQLS